MDYIADRLLEFMRKYPGARVSMSGCQNPYNGVLVFVILIKNGEKDFYNRFTIDPTSINGAESLFANSIANQIERTLDSKAMLQEIGLC